MSASVVRNGHHVPGVRGWVRKQLLRSLARVLEWTARLQRRSLDVSRVNRQLLVGGQIGASGYARLRAMGITHIIDLRAERSDDAEALAALGIELLHLPAPDRHPPPVSALLQGVEWALPRLANGAQVFCHCEHGVGRGPLMAVAILVAQGADPTEAYRSVRRVRWQATLNDRQIQGLMRFVDALRAREALHTTSHRGDET